MKKIDFFDVSVTDGFWKQKIDLIKNTSIMAIYDRFNETHRFDALNCDWRKKGEYEAHFFWDSDVAKWIEAASLCLQTEKNEKIESIIDELIDRIITHSDEFGYFNSYFLNRDKDKRFKIRGCHELYCAGHFIEAAIAYKRATGKDAFLNAMCRYADYIEKVFKTEKSADFVTPGHPEIELALVKLYNETGEKSYLELSKYFIDERGRNDECPSGSNPVYSLSDMPVRDRKTIDGHCVRALYLLCGCADIAEKYNDKDLFEVCKRLFDNITENRMYITGGIGNEPIAECFTDDYNLPNRYAYAETCASIALAMFSLRMQNLECDSKYADTVERVMYNGILSGISIDGKSFFYENPLEIDREQNKIDEETRLRNHFAATTRQEYFECSCCPPNISRFILSIADYTYSCNDETLFINQYLSSKIDIQDIKLNVETNYPVDGLIKVSFSGNKKYIALRIPAWCKNYSINCDYVLKNGYAYIKVDQNVEILLNLDMSVRVIKANRMVRENAGRVAVMRGPIVYCLEEIDNGSLLRDVSIDINSNFTICDNEFILPSLKTTAFRHKDCNSLYECATDNDYVEFEAKFIPYYAFANRNESDMIVWVLRK